MMLDTRPFAAPRYAVEGLHFELIGDAASDLAEALSFMDPWHRLGVSAASLKRSLSHHRPGTFTFQIKTGGELCGAAVFRSPFLRGPYLELLAIPPQARRAGIGRRVIGFMEAEAKGDHNFWVCVSDWNRPAIDFYRSLGFAEVGVLPDLVSPGFSELFMRKRL